MSRRKECPACGGTVRETPTRRSFRLECEACGRWMVATPAIERTIRKRELPRATHGINADGERDCLEDPCPECNPWGTDPDAWKGGGR